VREPDHPIERRFVKQPRVPGAMELRDLAFTETPFMNRR